MNKIILASKSPRRHELLKLVCNDFEIDVSDINEKYPLHLSKKKVPEYIATLKAREVFKRHQDDLVIGADTIVICNHQILGKPKDKKDVRKMITMLQNMKFTLMETRKAKAQDKVLITMQTNKVFM